MGVTEVVRGDDLLASAARQWHVQRALGLSPPAWFHVPLVVDEGGKRLAKRTDAVAIAKFRERGVDPREIVGWIARRSGMEVEGRASAREIAGVFEMGRVPRKVVVCGVVELAEIGVGST